MSRSFAVGTVRQGKEKEKGKTKELGIENRTKQVRCVSG
jgi:hypothetical protein